MYKVLLIGVTPPPIGGVSMHIQRFVEQFHAKKEFHLDALDLKKKKLYREKKKLTLFQIIKVLYKSDIIHLHISNNLKVLIALLGKVFGKKVIYTHHNIRVKSLLWFKLLMLFVDRLILVNDNDIDKKVIIHYDYELIPAFLPSNDETKLPKELEIQLDSYEFVVSTNCFELTFINGKDLYGFDLCIEAFKNLVETQNIRNTVLILVDPSNSSREYVTQLLENFVSSNGCKVLFIGEKLNFNRLVEKSDIVLRATRSDGDSLTVREALYLNVPIIASDVTIRPQGTICFKHEDINDLAKHIDFVLNKSDKLLIEDYENINYGDKILEVYQSLL
ncbi:MAG TPA: glycosyltransferase family 1 protein [Arcobacter sp.]|nr:glycosyltransferase family 1 protein [Arcobacter sp.]